jgi:cysteine desulfurase/selenocysteine lyase
VSQCVHYIGMKTNSIATIYTDEFPTLNHGLYANHAAIAPWPRITAQAVVDFAKENSDIGPEKYHLWLLRETQLRNRLATLLNANSADDIALLKNTTEGICTVANGIDWQPGDNIVIPADEFPSNRLPWLALVQLGVDIREVDIRATEDPEQALLSRMDGHTRLLSVSAIQWTDGLRLKLKILGRACRQNGILFFVDAIQQLGAMQIDVQDCRIDFLAADGHKWLLAPEGLAVFYCREGVREQLRPSQQGWHMLDDPYQFNRHHWLASKTAMRFEAGSPNMLCQAAMHASVGVLLDTGMQQVERLVTENSATLAKGLSAMPGIELVRQFDQQRVSGIVSFRPPDGKPVEFQRALKTRGLNCTVRGDGIRLSPHFYQSGKPLLEMLDVIDQLNQLC